MSTIRTAVLAAGSVAAGANVVLYTVPAGYHARVTGVLVQSSGTPAFIAVYFNRPGSVSVGYAWWTPAANPDLLTLERDGRLEEGDEVKVFTSAGISCVVWLNGTTYEN